MWLPFVTAAVGSFFGSVGGFLSALTMARRAERYKTTTDLMNEYFSIDFTHHRESLFQTGRRLATGDVDVDDIALGFWFPGGLCYIGETYASLTEHQHLTVYIGYIVRLADSVSRRRVDLTTLQNGLGTELLWEYGLVSKVAHAAARQADKAGAPTPSWPDSVKTVHDSVLAPRIAKQHRNRQEK
ncbi:hypothetical protein ACIA2T_37635 [Amycolatopsis japonica]|uniref:hypothetical protein n=1 Tax=Amycolatopsis japonica TaxID=208439 RepID=UPI0037A802DC